MKLGTFAANGRTFIGVVDVAAGMVFDPLAAVAATGADEPAFRSMLDLIDAGEAALDRLRRLTEVSGGEPAFSHRLDGLDHLPPVPQPRQLREAALFPGHIRRSAAGMRMLAARLAGREPTEAECAPLDEVPAVFRERPVSYFQNRLNVVGHGATVRWPRDSRVMDFELEFGVFLGRGGIDIPARAARGLIFGFTLYDDFSARDLQLAESRSGFGPTKSKSFEGANAMGPWIVTADEIPDPYGLAMAARVNGETWASGTSAGMLFSFEELIAHYSRDERLHAGEFLASGTAAGGTGLEIGRYPESGDLVELECEGIGILANRLVAADAGASPLLLQ